jgi:hypothetical protein
VAGHGIDQGITENAAAATPHSAADDYMALVQPQGDSHATASQPGAEQSSVAAGQEHIAANATSAGDYMALVQSQSSDHAAASQTAADHSSSTADYSHMMTDASSPAAQGPQEPPSADHLFADAHVDAGAAHDAGGGMDPGAGVHADAAAIPPAAEPPPAAPEEQGHGAGH